MAIRLTGWLEDTFTTELLLGNNWLQEKHAVKELGLPPDPDSRWAGLYRDNGSSFDILNHIHPERNSNLQLLQNPRAPLTLTDGRCEVVAHFTAQCLGELHARCPHIDLVHAIAPGLVVAVRRYAIRYTSYGPPRDQLRLILHAVDWVGHNYTIARVQSTPLSSVATVRAVLQQLHDTRAREDSRCFRAHVNAQVGEEPEPEPEPEETPRAMEHSDSASADEPTSHTQLAYGTQVSHAIRPRVVDNEPQLVSVNRVEPVLTGNTQRKEPRHESASLESKRREDLLNLLKQSGRQRQVATTSTSANAPVHAPSNDQYGNPVHAGTDTPTQTPVTVHQSYVSSEPVPNKKRQLATSPEPGRGIKRMRNSDFELPEIANSEQKLEKAVSNQINQLDEMASACSWMAGLKLNHATITVPNDQRYILGKAESWRKPLPGNRFPDYNIPSKTWQFLWRLADEATAEQVDPDSDSDIDPSPDSILESIDPSPDSMLQVDQEQEPPTSQVSWSASPSPEPPSEPPAKPLNALPPDSSFEADVTTGTVHTVQHRTISSQESQNSTVAETLNEQEPSVPSSSSPVAVTSQEYDEGMEMEMEISIPQGLGEDMVEKPRTRQVESYVSGPRSPRSRPVVLVEETPFLKRSDMRISEYAKSESTQNVEANSTWKTPSSTSIVLGTYNNPSPFDCDKTHNDNKSPDFKTKNTQASKEELCVESEQQTRKVTINPTEHEEAQSAPSLNSTTGMEASRNIAEQEDSICQTQTIQTETASSDKIVLLPDSTLISAQIPEKDLYSSGGQNVPSLKKDPELSSHIKTASSTCSMPATEFTKRKLDYSPSKKSSRHSKRREIKRVGFGDDAPSSIDTTATLRREREESLSRFRAEQKASKGFVDRPGSAHKTQALQDDVEMVLNSPGRQTSTLMTRAMSPRHLSLYEDPSPIERPAAGTVPAQSVLRNFDGKDHVECRAVVSNREQDYDPSNEQAKPNSKESDSGILERPTKEASQSRQNVSFPVEKTQPSPIAGNPTTVNPVSMTVFQRFKEAYPDYTGNIEHFVKQCTQMYNLDLKDRMVPKWQWDDFIIRSLTDFKDYAIECLVRGQDVEEYIQFYKDHVRNTKFQKEIVVNRDMLVRVMEESGLQPPTLEDGFGQPIVPERIIAPSPPPARISEQPPTHIRTANPPTVSQSLPQNPKPSRASLPDAFNQHKILTQDRINRIKHNQLRHSLPVASRKTHQSPPTTSPYAPTARTHIGHSSTTRSTPRPNLLSRLTIDATPSTRTPRSRDLTPTTGDAYHEYVIGWQRMKSLTGSSAADATAPWPQNLSARRSVRDVVRGRDDVLRWSDEL